MAQINVTDEWLYKVMPLIDEALIRNIEDNVDYEYEFSADFEKRMKRLIAKERRSAIWQGFLKLSRRTAAVVVTILASFSICTVSVQAYRTHLFKTIKTAWEDSVLYSYMFGNSDSEDVEFVQISPINIPKGYELIEQTESELFHSLIYENENGDQMIWDQQRIVDTSLVVLDSEYDWKKSVKINAGTLEIYGYSDGHKMAYLEHERYTFTVYADHLEVLDIKKLFE